MGGKLRFLHFEGYGKTQVEERAQDDQVVSQDGLRSEHWDDNEGD